MIAAALVFGLAVGLGLVATLIRPGKSSKASELTVSSPVSSPYRRLFDTVSDMLARAGWGALSTPSVIGLWLGMSVAAGAVVVWLVPLAALGPLAAIAVLLGGVGMVRARIERRERALRAVWPGLVDHLRQAVRSGAAVGEAVWILRDHVPDELVPAFESYRKHVDGGRSVAHSLSTLKDDIANPVSDRIIESLRMAHEVGGSELPRILSNLQTSIRADWQVREDALAKQAWIRSASKLGVSAPWLVLVMLSGRPETQASYQTPIGVGLLLAGAGVSAVAYRMMKKLGSLPDEKRWFA
jgi:tight adherence protein B